MEENIKPHTEQEDTTAYPEQNENVKHYTERDLYDDNIYDVRSIDDLDDVANVNLLSKEGDTYRFELGGDFWEYKKGDGLLRQYPDYVSLVKEKNGILGYDEKNGEENPLLGKAIKKAIDSETSFEAMPNFSFAERKNYILEANGSVVGGVKLPVKLATAEQVEKKSKKVEENIDKAVKSIDTAETKPMLDLLKLALKTLSMFFMFHKKDTLEYEKEKMLKMIVDGLDKNELDISKILSDKELHNRIPELSEVLKKYSQSTMNLNIGDEKKAITELMKDKEVISVADKLSEDRFFKEQIADNFAIKLIKELDVTLPQGYDEKMRNIFSKSNEKEPMEFSKDLLLKNLNELYLEDKKIGSNEYGVAVAYMAQMVNPDENKHLLAECLAKRSIESPSTNLLLVVEKIVNKCIKNELAQEEQLKQYV